MMYLILGFPKDNQNPKTGLAGVRVFPVTMRVLPFLEAT